MANNEYLISNDTLSNIADKVRTKTGTTETIIGADMVDKIDSILTPTDGTIPTKTSSDLTASGSSIIVPAGYYASQASKSVATATQATPSISISSSGLITASSTQSAGYVSSGTKSATKQLTTKAATTITPGTSSQTAVASGVYTTGAITVAGDADLVASNIKSGVNIFGVTGTYEGSGLDTLSSQAANSVQCAYVSSSSGLYVYKLTFTFPYSMTTLVQLSGYVYSLSGSTIRYYYGIGYANNQVILHISANASSVLGSSYSGTGVFQTSGTATLSGTTLTAQFSFTPSTQSWINSAFSNMSNYAPSSSVTAYYK